jgi:outer membrane protein OmpA-like peptidoglycan-associated protein
MKKKLHHRLCIALMGTLLLVGCQTPPSAPVYTGPTLSIQQSPRGVQLFLPSNALFESGKSTLDEALAGPYIRRVAELLNGKTDKLVQLEGHTDTVGSLAFNQPLSEARALSIKNALVKAGVAAERLSNLGFAFNRPVASNVTEEGRKLNRRVEVIILGETVEAITKGEASNSFESAWDKLKSLIDQGLVKPVEARP